MKKERYETGNQMTENRLKANEVWSYENIIVIVVINYRIIKSLYIKGRYEIKLKWNTQRNLGKLREIATQKQRQYTESS